MSSTTFQNATRFSKPYSHGTCEEHHISLYLPYLLFLTFITIDNNATYLWLSPNILIEFLAISFSQVKDCYDHTLKPFIPKTLWLW